MFLSTNDKKRLRGLRAKRAGESWENILKGSAYRCGARFIPFPSGCRWITKHRAVSVKTPMDFILIKDGHSVYIDAKTILESAFPYSQLDQNQVYWLSQAAAGGERAGYLVSFRAIKKVVFFSVELLSSLRPRQSLKPEDGLQLFSDFERVDLSPLFNGHKENKSHE